MAYDENGWARRCDYAEQSADEAMELFKWLRRQTYRLIQTLPESPGPNHRPPRKRHNDPGRLARTCTSGTSPTMWRKCEIHAAWREQQ